MKKHLAAAIVTATATVAGGATAADAEGPRVTRWDEAPQLPVPAAGNAVAWMHGRLWSIGGTTWQEDEKRWLARVDSWAPGEEAWRHEGDLPKPLAHAIASPGTGGLVLIGGSDSDAAIARVQQLNLRPLHDISELASLPQPTVLAAGGVVGDIAIIAGGASSVSGLTTTHARVFTLAIGRDKAWQPGPDMPGGPRAIAASVARGGEVLVFGGCRIDAGRVVNHHDAWAWSKSTGQWRRLADLPAPTRGATAVALGDRFVLLLGGYADGGGRNGFLSDALVYDRERDHYTQTLPLPVALGVTGVAVAGQSLYVVGGEDAPKSRSNRVFVGALE